MTTPDASTPRTGSNPFGRVAQPAAELRLTELTARRDDLDRENELLGSQIGELLSDKFDAALADDHKSLEDQIAAAEDLQEDLEAIKALLSGISSAASASALTDLQQQAIDDLASGRLFKHPDNNWGDRDYRPRRSAPAPAAPAATPAPATTTAATSAPAPAAPAAPSTPATSAPAPAASAATPAPVTPSVTDKVTSVLGKMGIGLPAPAPATSPPAPAAPAATPAPSTTTPATSAPAPAAPAAPAPTTT